MRVAGGGLRDGGAVLPFYSFNEDVKLATEEIELRLPITIGFFVRERSGFKKIFQVVDRFVAGGVSEDKKANKFLFIAAAAIALDDIGTDRFHRATSLTSFFVYLELRQLVKCHAMHPN